MPAVKDQFPQKIASKDLEAQQQVWLKGNKASAEQKCGYVDFREVINVRNSLAKG